MTTQIQEKISITNAYKEKLVALRIPKYEECDIDDETDSETKANSVYDSSAVLQIRNSLVLSKGSPKKGFKVENLPAVDSCSIDNTIGAFAVEVHVSNRFKTDNRFTSTCRESNKTLKRNWSCAANRKSSTEILLNLQNRLSKHNTSDGKLRNFDFSPKKIIMIKDTKEYS